MTRKHGKESVSRLVRKEFLRCLAPKQASNRFYRHSLYTVCTLHAGPQELNREELRVERVSRRVSKKKQQVWAQLPNSSFYRIFYLSVGPLVGEVTFGHQVRAILCGFASSSPEIVSWALATQAATRSGTERMVRNSIRQLKGLDQEELKREVERLEDAGPLRSPFLLGVDYIIND